MNSWGTKKFIIISVSVIVLGIVIDQILKVIFENMYDNGILGGSGSGLYLFGNVGLEYVENPGAAFSFLANFEKKNVVFFLLTILGIPAFVALLWVFRKKHLIGVLGYCGIISGTIGNAIDRLFRGDGFFNGKVRDFFTVGDWFATFNFADSLLVCGAIAVVLSLLFFDDDGLFVPKKKTLISEETDGKKNDD